MPLPEEVVNSFPEEIRADASLQAFNDVPSLAKGFVETKSMVGRSIQLPGKDSKPEEVEKWRGEQNEKLRDKGYAIAPLGELPPSKFEDYKLADIEGFTPDPKQKEAFLKDVALATKMTPKQVEAVMKFEAGRMGAMKDAFVSEEAAEAEFKEMMGEEYEAANTRVTTAMKALSEDQPAIGKLAARLRVFEVDENGKPAGKVYPFNKHPLGKGFYEVFASLTQEDHSAGATPGGETIDSIETKIQDIRANKELSAEEQGRRLEPLYKVKAKLKPRAA